MATKQATTDKPSNPAPGSESPARPGPGSEVAERPQAALAEVAEFDYAGDAGGGMEDADRDSFAIPFLGVLQKNSPQVDEASGVALPGAKQGMFYENVTGKMYDGQKGVIIVPCAFRRVFIRWAPRAQGGGFKGEFSVEQQNELRAKREVVEMDNKLFYPLPDGSVNPDKCDRLSDTRNHYVLLLDEDNTWRQALLSLASTQIRKSKTIMAMLSNVQVRRQGVLITPPTWASKIKLTTVGEKNDKGSWMGIIPELAGRVEDPQLYAAGKQFNETVRKGTVEVKYEAPADEGTAYHDGGARPSAAHPDKF